MGMLTLNVERRTSDVEKNKKEFERWNFPDTDGLCALTYKSILKSYSVNTFEPDSKFGRHLNNLKCACSFAVLRN